MTVRHSIGDSRPSPVLDVHRVLAAALSRSGGRMAWILEAAFILAWFGLRMIDAERPVMAAWGLGAVLLALIAPTSGLVVVAAIAPFNEGLLVTRAVGIKPVVLVAVVAGIAVRVALDRRAWGRPPTPVLLAGFLLLSMPPGLLVSWQRFGQVFFVSAAQVWFFGIATAFLAFLAAAWIGRRGDLRPLTVAAASAMVASLVSLADYIDPSSVRGGLLGWMTTGDASGIPATRLTGVMESPTSTAALVMLPACLLLSAALVGRDLRLRVASAIACVPLLIAAYATFNRAVFLVLFALAVAVAWRRRARYGLALLAAGILAGALLLPAYMSLRADSVGRANEPGQLLQANDRQRLNGWATAIRMFADAPLVGHGYRAYREVAPAYGDTTQTAPHNEWLRLFAEHGIVVGLAGVGFVLVTARRLWRLPGWLGVGIFGAFVSFGIMASFNNAFLFNQVTIVAFVIAGTGVGLVRGPTRADADRPAADPPTVRT